MSVSTDPVQHWLAGASRYPLLNKGQEVQLSRDIHAWLDCENPSPQVARRGKRAKDKLFNCNLRLVASVGKKYQGRIVHRPGLSFEDLLQQGCIGLNRACEKFDHERGFAFSTFSYWWIRQAIGRYVEINQSTIKISTGGSQLAQRWRYRPKGMTIEEFAEQEGRSVKNCKEYIDYVERATVYSLDAQLKGKVDDEASTLLDFVSTNDVDLEESDWVEAVQGLNQIDEIKDAMALLELAQGSKPKEMAELLDCNYNVIKNKLKDAKAVIREHTPSHIRERIVGKEQKVSYKISQPIQLPEPLPAKELALVSCCSDSSLSMPDAITQPSANGHSQSLEAEAMEVIAAVQSGGEPEPQAKAKRTRNRTKPEVTPVKPQGLINVSVEGCNYEGTAADVAQLINALRAA